MICMYFKNKLLVKKSAKTHVIYIDIVCYEFFSPHNFKICLFIYNTMEEPSIIYLYPKVLAFALEEATPISC